MNFKLPIYYLMLLFCYIFYGQTDNNMLDTSTWTVGTGSVDGFSQYGVTAENSRVSGEDHLGNNVILWQASPDSAGEASGGFYSSPMEIDHTKTYRLSIWINKTHSNNGSTQLKAHSYLGGIYHTTNLNGTSLTWHPFWHGDLPKLDRWYLLVGYIHGSTYNSNISQGKIYDGVTGEVVISMNDHKFKSSATVLQHKTILYGDTNTMDRQYMYAPKMEEVDGDEPSINELMSINPDSKLLFAYDNAGNQKQRFYCADASCTVPTPPTGRVAPKDDIVSKEVKIEEDNTLLEKEIALYPNPTKGMMSVKLNSNSEITLSHSISVYNNIGMLVHSIPTDSKNKVEIDLSNLSTGTYFVHIHSSNGNSITKKIIKE